jgi:hypothetical protein
MDSSTGPTTSNPDTAIDPASSAVTTAHDAHDDNVDWLANEGEALDARICADAEVSRRLEYAIR